VSHVEVVDVSSGDEMYRMSLLAAARPVVLQGLLATEPRDSWLPVDLLTRDLISKEERDKPTLRVDVTPHAHPLAPFKRSKSLLRRAERLMSPSAILALLQNTTRGYHAYVQM